MHLYALWAPDTSRISYGYIDPDTGEIRYDFPDAPGLRPTPYRTDSGEQTIPITAEPKKGYTVAGWYIYQDPSDNANWGLVAKFMTEDPTKLDLAAMKDPTADQFRLCSVDGVLMLTVPSHTFGPIILIAEYVPQYVSLTITKSADVSQDTGDGENQSFLFHIQGKAFNDNLGNQGGHDVDMVVAITGNGSKMVKDLPVGYYTVTELTDWSWRYALTGSTVIDAKITQDGYELLDPKAEYTFTFTNTRTNPYWLSGDSIESNWWGSLVQSIQSLFAKWRGGN